MNCAYQTNIYKKKAQTVTGILATSADGVSRYLAPDGPIQPALTAIGGLPIRAVELANSGITQVSSGMDSMAHSIARAGGNEQIAMPGLAALQSVMPSPVGQLGNMASSMIQTKNRLIMGQAEAGIDAGNRLRTAMEQGLQGSASASVATPVVAASLVRSARAVNNNDAPQMEMAESGKHMSTMMSQMGDGLQGVSKQATGALEQVRTKLERGLHKVVSQAQSMGGKMSNNMRGQTRGILSTLTNGFQGVLHTVQGTASQLSRQLQSGMQQNMHMASGMMDQMHGNMGGVAKEAENMMGQMQNGLASAIGRVQNVAEKSVQNLHKSTTGLLDNFSNMASSMMQAGSQGGKSMGGSGRY